MATVTRHLIGSLAEWARTGLTYREVVRVAGAAGASVAAAQYAALTDGSVPAPGDTLVFGDDPDEVTLFLSKRTVRSTAKEAGSSGIDVFIDVLWSNDPSAFPQSQGGPVTVDQPPDPEPDDDGTGLLAVGSLVESVETEFDVAGDEIIVRRAAECPPVTQPVRYRRPRPVLEFSRWEQSSPRSRAETFVGKLNNATWNGYAIGTVLCTSIVGTSRDNGATYDVRYEFEYRPNGWTELVVYIDEDTGRPISPLVPGVSVVDVTLYEEVDFAPLSITL